MDGDEMLTQLSMYVMRYSSKHGTKATKEAAKSAAQVAPKKIKVVNVPEVPAGFQFRVPAPQTSSRLNPVPKDWTLPRELYVKQQPKYSVGVIVRVSDILRCPEVYFDKIVTVAGWARTVRCQANNTLVFIELNDGSCLKSLQIVVDKSVSNFEKLLKSNTGFSYRIVGKLVKSPAQSQPIEMSVKGEEGQRCDIIGEADPLQYPMAKGYQTPETLREKAHLRPRSNFIGAVTRVRNNLALATHLFFQNHGFQYIHTPIITASDCEGAGEMFQVTTVLPKNNKIKDIPTDKNTETINYNVDFFKRPANLTVSGQLAVENFCCALSNVYTFGPTFRAENSHTSRHLAEFWMIEPELAFADLYDNMDCSEAYVKFCLKYVLENNKEDLQFLDEKIHKGLIKYLTEISDADFVKCSYTEAIELLEEAVKLGAQFENPVSWGIDLASEHERFLAEKVFKRPVFLYNYPKAIKAFYMKVTEDGKCVRAMDLLIPQIGELVGGSQREENLQTLEKRIQECGLNVADYWWYLDLRRYGTVPHSGFGLGFERLVMMATGVDNIRDVIPYPRYPGNADF